MADSLTLLDQALFLGEQELAALSSGDVDTADLNFRERGRLLDEAWERREGVALDVLHEKLLKMQNLQGRLAEEARRLHSGIKDELQRSRKHSTRLKGYRKAVTVTPLHSHFVSKQG